MTNVCRAEWRGVSGGDGGVRGIQLQAGDSSLVDEELITKTLW